MKMTFREKWLETVERKNSVLCAGLDPSDFYIGRGDKGLPIQANKLVWSLHYLEAVAPYCAAVKPNVRFFGEELGNGILETIAQLAHELGMVMIQDSKEADIGNTNETGFYYAGKRTADAITFSPFAGNIEEGAKFGKKFDIGVISMCIMSNPEYAREKMKLVRLDVKPGAYTAENYNDEDVIEVLQNKSFWVPQYIQLAHDAAKYGIDGLVIGAPSSKNHITPEEISKIRQYAGDNMLVLMPGVGAQGGDAKEIFSYFSPENVIVNLGTAMMFPNGQNSTPIEQAATAKQYMEMLNNLRGK